MSLAPGAHLGPYEILALLGAGGMGEVYRARDTRLGRTVAIKVIRRDLTPDLDRIERFEREARSASALNHPNIVTIHDFGSEDGTSYIAMEWVDGSSLRDLVASASRSRLPWSQTLARKSPRDWRARIPPASCIATSNPTT